MSWLTDLVTQPSGGAATNLLTNITYSGVGGAAGKPTGASVANGVYSFSASYDNNLRLASESITDGATTLYALSLGYDGASNVTSAATQLDQSSATQTDNQDFCYDEQNRLTSASTFGVQTPGCGNLPAGSLTAAEYTQSFSYDALGRLASSTSGSYSYNDSAHLHAVTTISSPTAYSAAYDVAGNMICRAPTSAATCAGTQTGWTGQLLAYDNAERLTHWASFQHQVGTQSVADFLYDGSGQRVEQQRTPANQATATTHYVLGGLEEDSGGQLTKYLSVPGLPSAIRVGTSGALSYLASDVLGSVTVALDGAGNVTAAQLYAPYGGLRYSSGTMPTAKGFTGQRADAATGLDYYNARYYDPAAGQFTSADTVASGLSPYAYVKGNPETLTDPTGHKYAPPTGGGGDPTNDPGDPGHGRCDPAHPADCGNGHRPPPPHGQPPTPPGTCTPTGGAKACLGTGGTGRTGLICDHICRAKNDAEQAANSLDEILNWLAHVQNWLLAGALVMLLGPLGAGIASAIGVWVGAMDATSSLLHWMAKQDNQFWGNQGAVEAALALLVAIPGLVYGAAATLAGLSAVIAVAVSDGIGEIPAGPIQIGLLAGGESELTIMTMLNITTSTQIWNDYSGDCSDATMTCTD